jgi:hypothetical protein
MATQRTRTQPKPSEIWLSCPPYLLIAEILAVDTRRSPGVVSYELHDENGFPLEQAAAALDDGWWQAFQPLVVRRG